MIFFTAGLVSLFVDPLFFFLPIAQPDFCFDTGRSLQVVLTIARTVYDVFYVVHIFVQFRTAYIAPSSRVFGRGELVIDPWKIAYQYLVKGFWADVMAAVPLPQVSKTNAVLLSALATQFSHVRSTTISYKILTFFSISDSSMGNLTESKRFGDFPYSYSPLVHHLVAVLSESSSHISTLLPNRQFHRGHDYQKSLGRGRLQHDALHIGQPCE